MLLLLSGLCAVAQDTWVGEDLPWMLERQRGGVRCVRQYEPSDSVMGARRLVSERHYDRHGYACGPLVRNEYDSLGRLRRHCEMEEREVAGVRLRDTVRVLTVTYSAEGMVSVCHDMSLRRLDATGRRWATDTHIVCHQLVGLTLGGGHGVTGCTYRRTNRWLPARYFGMEQQEEAPYNTESLCRCERQYDEAGHLVREAAEDCDEGLNTYAREYVYGSQGRIEQEIRALYEWSDTLTYRYNTAGTLIGMDGVGHSEGMKIDIHIRCQADGRPLEESQVWWDEEGEGGPEGYPRAVARTYYNTHGEVAKRVFPGEPVYEYDYEYWD